MSPATFGSIVGMTDTAHPLVVRARRLAADLLVPEAERVDQEGVPASLIGALKESGLLGAAAPVAYGGFGAPSAVVRETTEILAGACCPTWFVQARHHTPVQTAARGELPVRESLLGPLPTRGSRHRFGAATQRTARLTR